MVALYGGHGLEGGEDTLMMKMCSVASFEWWLCSCINLSKLNEYMLTMGYFK